MGSSSAALDGAMEIVDQPKKPKEYFGFDG
jgi:hypothetical protein